MGTRKDSDTENTAPGSADFLAPGEVVIGSITGLSADGQALVDFPQNDSGEAIAAMSTLAINPQHAGRQVALLFTAGDLHRPLIIGLIHSPLQDLIDGFQASDKPAQAGEQSNPAIETSIDGRRVVIEGQDEVVLKCGDASITLTKNGKIVIRGRYLLNRSTGVNRILGGSVQIN